MTRSVISGSVVVGVDGSPHSDAAIEWAARYAVEHRRPLTIVHAAGSIARVNTLVDPAVSRQSLRMAGRRITDAALAMIQEIDPDLEVAVHMALAEPREVLIDAAEHAALLVLGSRGRGTIATFVLGSVSVGVSAHAVCPVVVVRQGRAPLDRPAEGSADGHVVVGVDGTESSAAALEFAFDTASWQHRRLDVVHTWGGDGPYPALLTYEQRRELMAEHELRVAESLAGFAEKYPDVVVGEYVVENDPAKALIAASERAALVVTGSRGRSDTASVVLGSVSRSVVEHSKCSVAVVRRH
ncbi:MAG: universal stress protein [Nocardioides sp.]